MTNRIITHATFFDLIDLIDLTPPLIEGGTVANGADVRFTVVACRTPTTIAEACDQVCERKKIGSMVVDLVISTTDNK